MLSGKISAFPLEIVCELLLKYADLNTTPHFEEKIYESLSHKHLAGEEKKLRTYLNELAKVSDELHNEILDIFDELDYDDDATEENPLFTGISRELKQAIDKDLAVFIRKLPKSNTKKTYYIKFPNLLKFMKKKAEEFQRKKEPELLEFVLNGGMQICITAVETLKEGGWNVDLDVTTDNGILKLFLLYLKDSPGHREIIEAHCEEVTKEGTFIPEWFDVYYEISSRKRQLKAVQAFLKNSDPLDERADIFRELEILCSFDINPEGIISLFRNKIKNKEKHFKLYGAINLLLKFDRQDLAFKLYKLFFKYLQDNFYFKKHYLKFLMQNNRFKEAKKEIERQVWNGTFMFPQEMEWLQVHNDFRDWTSFLELSSAQKDCDITVKMWEMMERGAYKEIIKECEIFKKTAFEYLLLHLFVIFDTIDEYLSDYNPGYVPEAFKSCVITHVKNTASESGYQNIIKTLQWIEARGGKYKKRCTNLKKAIALACPEKKDFLERLNKKLPAHEIESIFYL